MGPSVVAATHRLMPVPSRSAMMGSLVRRAPVFTRKMSTLWSPQSQPVIPKRAPLVDPTARSFAKAPPGSAGSWLSDNASVIPERIALSNARRVVVKVPPHL